MIDFLLVVVAGVFAFCLLRIEVVHRVRIRAIYERYGAYRAGPTYDQMLVDITKWTFNQFYPEAK